MAPSSRRVILLQAQAPAKPPAGAACNGCGVCCAWQPCPIGMLLSRRTKGPCAMLRWVPDERRYRCGAASHPRPWLRRLALRWIAAGQGCDCNLEAAPAME